MLKVLENTTTGLDVQTLVPATAQALYVHVPFCFHKCHYCDFYSITHQSTDRMERFMDLVLREAAVWDASPVSVQPRTIFFGGGTPSLLPVTTMQRLLRGLAERFDLSRVDEWTIEANPATVTSEFCSMLRENGVTRMSFGAQSFNRDELKTLERHHDPDDLPKSIDIARSTGFERLNIDLIYAIPGQTFDSWSQSLESAIALNLSHLSCYGLTFEPNTPIAVRRRLGLLQQAAEPLELQMLHHTRDRLASAGLPAYEISNYAREGEECRHNLAYWTGQNYIALGPSGASHIEGARWRNRPHLGEWERAVESKELPAIDVETLSSKKRAGELAMLLLRLSRGLNFADYLARTNLDARVLFADPIDRYTRAGLLEVDNVGVRLTRSGLSVADSLASEFLNSSR